MKRNFRLSFAPSCINCTYCNKLTFIGYESLFVCLLFNGTSNVISYTDAHFRLLYSIFMCYLNWYFITLKNLRNLAIRVMPSNIGHPEILGWWRWRQPIASSPARSSSLRDWHSSDDHRECEMRQQSYITRTQGYGNPCDEKLLCARDPSSQDQVRDREVEPRVWDETLIGLDTVSKPRCHDGDHIPVRPPMIVISLPHCCRPYALSSAGAVPATSMFINPVFSTFHCRAMQQYCASTPTKCHAIQLPSHNEPCLYRLCFPCDKGQRHGECDAQRMRDR